MGYLICDKCGGSYELQEGESPGDFSDVCECGGTLRYVDNLNSNQPKNTTGLKYCPKCGTGNSVNDKFCSNCGTNLVESTENSSSTKYKSNKLSKFWNNRDKKGKALVGTAGVCCFGVIVLIILAGFGSSDAGISSDQMRNAANVTAAQLYNGSGELIGKPVEMTGEVIQTGDGQIRIADVNLDEYGYNQGTTQDVLVNGKTTDLTLYENDIVVVYGIFKGQTSYTTVLGANRNVPEISNAIIKPTGGKVKQ